MKKEETTTFMIVATWMKNASANSVSNVKTSKLTKSLVVAVIKSRNKSSSSLERRVLSGLKTSKITFVKQKFIYQQKYIKSNVSTLEKIAKKAKAKVYVIDDAPSTPEKLDVLILPDNARFNALEESEFESVIGQYLIDGSLSPKGQLVPGTFVFVCCHQYV